MALTTQEDSQLLSRWEISPELSENREALTAYGQVICRTFMDVAPEQPPEKNECEDLLTFSILTSRFFEQLIQQHLNFTPQSVHERVARSLSRYVLDNYWDEILSGKNDETL